MQMRKSGRRPEPAPLQQLMFAALLSRGPRSYDGSVTTAVGLFVAIPAVMMFNYLTGRVEAFDVEMDNSSSELIDYFLKRRSMRRS